MARHAISNNQRRGLLRLGLTVVAAGAALGAGGTAAQAAPASAAPAAPLMPVDSLGDNLNVMAAFEHALPGALGPVKDLQLDPLANTGVDPLDNVVGTQIADFKPLSSAIATDPLTKGGALRDLPLAGELTGLLPG
ncbi:hypothetical protein ACIHCQ_04730 [Streptomyces sp. NPDC052236]|uniref:hypothetical protein n=1 Tax=Streptomyces sp. NPDC052236 TaxID=3365686 RepID=UPI0037D8BD22